MRKYGVRLNFIALCLGASLSGVMIQPLFGQLDKGIELLNSGAYARAENTLRDTLKSESRNTTVRYYLGMALLLQDKYGEALGEFKTVKSEQAKAGSTEVPGRYQTSLALARAYLGLKQYGDAWTNLEAARNENGGSSEVYMYRGIYYLQQKKYPEAIAELEKATKLDPRDAYAYYYLGDAYSGAKQPDKMVEVFKIFLQLAPHAPEAPSVQERIAEAC